MKITLLADRGFGDQKLFTYLGLLGWSYAIRFRQAIHLTVAERTLPASKWVPNTGHAKMLRDVLITGEKTSIPAVVLKHQKGMKEAWYIATDRTDLGAAGVVLWISPAGASRSGRNERTFPVHIALLEDAIDSAAHYRYEVCRHAWISPALPP